MFKNLFKRMSLAKAIRVLRQEMKDDPGLYYRYQDNIAIEFQDVVRQRGINIDDKTLYEISNDAAIRFLNRWCS
jgi:hypothetical protein